MAAIMLISYQQFTVIRLGPKPLAMAEVVAALVLI